MTVKAKEYDFKWCPGCGDFGVRRALETAFQQRRTETELPAENNVVIAGIGCSGNLVHLLEDPQPYGFHGIHGRTLPVAFGVKMARPDLNVVVVAGDGDFLSIGMEHIAPQAARNLDITALVLDNSIYGLTKGQSSPTSRTGQVTISTPFGKLEERVDPLRLYLTLGVSFVASGVSNRIKDLSRMISDAMNHPGFAIVHIQSPCTTYNNTYELLKGNPAKNIEPLAWEIPADHDPGDLNAAQFLVRRGGVPVGVLYRDVTRKTLHARIIEVVGEADFMSPDKLMDSYAI